MTLRNRLAGLEQRARVAHPREVEVCTIWPGENLLTKYGPQRPGTVRIVREIHYPEGKGPKDYGREA